MTGGDILLEVRANTWSSRSGIQGSSGGKFKININAPPVRGRANAEIVDILAREFRVAKSQVLLLRGAALKEQALSYQRRAHGTPR